MSRADAEGRWLPRHRRAALLLAALVTGAVVLLVAAALQDTLVYYRTPTEVATGPAQDADRIRLAGEVVVGSVEKAAELTRFRLSDGTHETLVVQRGAIPGAFREGEDAVVEGVLDERGVLHSDTVAVKHANEYRARDR